LFPQTQSGRLKDSFPASHAISFAATEMASNKAGMVAVKNLEIGAQPANRVSFRDPRIRIGPVAGSTQPGRIMFKTLWILAHRAGRFVNHEAKSAHRQSIPGN